MKAMSHNQRFEILAELFKADTGFLAPGKSVPPETASDQYEIDRQYEWRNWTDSKALAMALQFIQALKAEAEEYDQLYAALETCDTNQIMQERDALRLRIKAVDDEHVQLQADREKMVQAYTELEKKYHEAMDIMSQWKNIDHAEAVARLLSVQRDLELAREVGQEQVAKAREERDFYEKRWKVRGKALEMPCLTCGSTEKAIRLKNGEIP